MNATTISKNYFTQIYDSITEMIFELSASGKIINCNNSVMTQLGWSLSELKNKKFDILLPLNNEKFSNDIQYKFNKNIPNQTSYLYLKHKMELCIISFVFVIHLYQPIKVK